MLTDKDIEAIANVIDAKLKPINDRIGRLESEVKRLREVAVMLVDFTEAHLELHEALNDQLKLLTDVATDLSKRR